MLCFPPFLCGGSPRLAPPLMGKVHCLAILPVDPVHLYPGPVSFSLVSLPSLYALLLWLSMLCSVPLSPWWCPGRCWGRGGGGAGKGGPPFTFCSPASMTSCASVTLARCLAQALCVGLCSAALCCAVLCNNPPPPLPPHRTTMVWCGAVCRRRYHQKEKAGMSTHRYR